MKDSLAIADELYMEFFSAILNISRSKDCTDQINQPETIKSLNEKFLRFAVADVMAGNTPLSIIAKDIVDLIEAGELQESNVLDYVSPNQLLFGVTS